MKKLKGFSVNLFRTGRLTLTVTNRNYDLPIANSRTLLVPSIKNEHLITLYSASFFSRLLFVKGTLVNSFVIFVF